MRKIVICTLGTSLFYPNLSSIPENNEELAGLRRAYLERNWEALAEELYCRDPKDRICGAEINSMASLLEEGLISERGSLYLCHSDTQDGQDVAEVLKNYYRRSEWQVTTEQIEGLQDENPKSFRTRGLRNLAKTISRIVRESGSPELCAINATGGYKAQIAIAVMLGQVFDIPVYYKHERFPMIISLPPLPISLDFRYWVKKCGVLLSLDKEEILPSSALEEDWDEKMEAMVEREKIDGVQYVELSPLGAIFLEAFKSYFERQSTSLLPIAVDPAAKKAVRLSDHSWGGAHTKVKAFLQKIVDVVPYVKEVKTNYLNPDLPKASYFRLRGSDKIEGVLSNGTWTVKFIVFTSASNPSQLESAVADLNIRLNRGDFGSV